MQRILLTVVALNVSLQVQKHFFLREDLAAFGALGGLQISLTTLALAGLYTAWLVRSASVGASLQSVIGSHSRVTVAAGLFALACAISILAAGNAQLAAFGAFSALEQFLLYFYVANALTSRDDAVFILRILLLGLILQSALMLGQAAHLLPDVEWLGVKTRPTFSGEDRLSGTIGSPNTAAAYLGMNMTVALAVVLSRLGRVDRWIAFVGLALSIGPMIFTSSRGGWISALVSCSIVVFVAFSRVSRRAVAAVLLSLIVLLVPFSHLVSERFSADDNGSSTARMPLNRLALAMVADHPVMGVGANNFAAAMQPYLAHDFHGDFVYIVHNTYLLVWAETGTGGLVAFVCFLAAVLSKGFQRSPLGERLALPRLGCAAAVVCAMIQMTVEPGRGGAAGPGLWILAGVIVVLSRGECSPELPRYPERLAFQPNCSTGVARGYSLK